MLEHVPHWLGRALDGVRAGTDKLAVTRDELGPFASMTLASQAFADGARLPERFTADGDGVSPPLHWGDPPAGTARLALLVEDADSPTPEPLVHALVWDLPPEAGGLEEGAIVADGRDPIPDVGRNSYGREGWLPPDPPTGHGQHRYVFQLFALGEGVAEPGPNPGRSALLEVMAGKVLAAGVLSGTFSRGESAEIGPIGAAAPA
jgi:Raf kinase inhibitor-like YbhB/YbcL family protein